MAKKMKMTEKMDMAMDKKMGIKDGSGKDNALDKKRGLKSDKKKKAPKEVGLPYSSGSEVEMRFVTPFQSFVPPVLDSTPEPGRSAKYFKADIPRYVNVYIKTDLTVTESQPLWTNVLKFYQGGCEHQVDGPYIQILINAGYTLG